MSFNYSTQYKLNKIMFTFDDEPQSVFTLKLFDFLNAESIRYENAMRYVNATEGNNLEIVSGAYDEGQVIGNYSYFHKNHAILPGDEIELKIKRRDKFKLKHLILGKRYGLLYGRSNLRVNHIQQELEYVNVLWHIDKADYKQSNKNCKNKAVMLISTRNKSTMLTHSMCDSTVNIMHELIPRIRNKKLNSVFMNNS